MAEDPQDALLAVAREIINNRGYLGLSLRTAAAAAGITPEVARRYYRNRDSLFAAALKLPVDPTTAIPTLVAPGIEGMGERLVRFMLDILKDPEARREIVSLARTGVNAGHALAGLQDFLERGVVDRIAGMIGVPDARMRSALITSYLLGIAMTRYGVRLEPLASASEEEVIRMVAPVIQDLLDPRKPVPGSARARSRSEEQRAGAGVPTPRVRTFEPDPKGRAAAARAAAARAAATGPAGAPVASPAAGTGRPASAPAASGPRAANDTPGSAGKARTTGGGTAKAPSQRPATAKGPSGSTAGKDPSTKPAAAHAGTGPATATAKPATARPAKPTRPAKPAGAAKSSGAAKPAGAAKSVKDAGAQAATAKGAPGPGKAAPNPGGAARRSAGPGAGTRADGD